MRKLQDQINNDFIESIKIKDTDKKDIYRVIVAEMGRGASKDCSDEEVIKVLKKLKESAIQCGTPNEIPIYDLYLPPMMSDVGLEDFIGLIITTEKFDNIKDFGKIMGKLQKSPLSSAIDNKKAGEIIKRLLTT